MAVSGSSITTDIPPSRAFLRTWRCEESSKSLVPKIKGKPLIAPIARMEGGSNQRIVTRPNYDHPQ
jgi:hypothetical protein